MTNKQVYIHRQIGTLVLMATHFLREQYNTRTTVVSTIAGATPLLLSAETEDRSKCLYLPNSQHVEELV